MAEKSVTQPGSVFDPSLFIDTYDDAELDEARLEADITNTANSAVNGDYVLVIGSRGLMDVCRCGTDDADTVMLELARAAAGKERCEAESFNDFNNLCFHFRDEAKARYGTVFAKNRLTKEMINPAVVSLIESKAFRVVLTTSPSPVVEKIMRDTWGDALNVLGISDKEHCDISENDKIDGDKSLMPPTLYYIFGRPDPTNSDYALNDNEKIEKMKVWLSGESAPKRILSYVRSKKLFAYGCKFDDWFFRFLWHTFRPNGDISKGDVALPFDIENSEEEKRLRDYLSRYNVHIVDNPEEYISRLAEKITANMTKFTGRFDINPTVLYRHVFISYIHCDYVNAMRIYNHLVDKKIPVWIDHYKLGGGDEFDKEINEGIESCGVFLPLLSANVRTDSEKILHWIDNQSADEPKENRSYYRANEWARGCNANAEWKVIPVSTFGYDYTKDYHYRVVPDKMRDVTVFDWTKQPVSELVELIKNALKSHQS